MEIKQAKSSAKKQGQRYIEKNSDPTGRLIAALKMCKIKYTIHEKASS